MNKRFWAKKIIGFTLLGILAVALFSYVVMILWNHTIAQLMPVSAISFWQAAGLLLLCKILFGGFSGGWGRNRGGHWKREMDEKWQGLSPEEREKLKQEWRNRCRVWKKPEAEQEKETGD